MPVHDWTRVDDGTYHAFHTGWLQHLAEALNEGVLPADYYALPEQVVARRQTDVLTLHATPAHVGGPPPGTAVAEVAPSVRLRLRPSPTSARRPAPRRTRRLTIRHATGHRVVAVVEIVSPGNKDRRASVDELAGKVVQLIENGVQVLLIDLFPPGKYDPHGIHGAIWSRYDPVRYTPPAEEPFTLASYRWDGGEPEVFLEPVGLGKALVDMPLFLNADRYVNAPLEASYMDAFRHFPAIWRRVLEGEAPGPPG